MTELEHLKYPIGRYKRPVSINRKIIENWINTLDKFPVKLQKLVIQLSENQLDTPYRDEGWTIRQVVHHCYDSHHNSYTRFKWALTEENPVIKAYDEAKWCALTDSLTAPIKLSLDGLKSLHAKWVYVLENLSESDLNRTYVHPEDNITYPLKEVLALYAWHCDHHYAHIAKLMERKEW